MRLLKENAVPGYNSFVEGQARLRAVPFYKLPDGASALAKSRPPLLPKTDPARLSGSSASLTTPISPGNRSWAYAVV